MAYIFTVTTHNVHHFFWQEPLYEAKEVYFEWTYHTFKVLPCSWSEIMLLLGLYYEVLLILPAQSAANMEVVKVQKNHISPLSYIYFIWAQIDTQVSNRTFLDFDSSQTCSPLNWKNE